MFEGLDDINWDELEHAYGSAADVPDQLRALASPIEEERKRALHACYGNIWHQGTVYEATAPAVPFLINIAAEPTVPDRHVILDLLAHLASGSSYLDAHKDLGFIGEGLRDRPGFDEQLDRELSWVTAAADAVAAGAPRYEELLADPEPAVRVFAAHLLGMCGPAAEAALPTLRRRLEDEDEPAARAAALYALLRLDEDGRPALITAALAEDRPLPRLVAAVVSAFTEQTGLSPRALEVLVDALRRPREIPEYAELPFATSLYGDIGAALTQAGEAQREEAAGRLIYALDEGLSDVLSTAGPLLGLCFPGGCQLEELDALSPLQRRALGAVARRAWRKTGESWSVFTNIVDELQRLGLEELGQELVGYDFE